MSRGSSDATHASTAAKTSRSVFAGGQPRRQQAQRRQPALADDALGLLGDDAEVAGDSAVVAGQRAVGERVVRLLGDSRAA